MTFQQLTKSQKKEQKIIKPLDSFFKTKDEKPFCFGFFGDYHIIKSCSDCKYKRECYKVWNEK